MTNTELSSRLVDVRSRISAACAKANRSQAEVELVIVTKNHSVELPLDLLELGERNFGENRDQEAAPKAQAVKDESLTELEPVWHFVGQLQTNKVKSVLNYASYLHSLDRESLLLELVKQLAKNQDSSLNVFIELNLTEDPNRGGIEPKNLLGFAEMVIAQPQLNLLGVMGVAGLDVSPERDFERIQEASNTLRKLHPDARFISAGMSGDFEKAIEFGATHVRVGTAITGPRQYP